MALLRAALPGKHVVVECRHVADAALTLLHNVLPVCNVNAPEIQHRLRDLVPWRGEKVGTVVLAVLLDCLLYTSDAADE